MFFILSKILLYFLLPMIWILLLLLYSYFAKSQKRKKQSLFIALILLFTLGNSFLAGQALFLWEEKPVEIASMPVYDTAIVLTGVTDSQRKPHDRVYYTRGADRVLHTIQLYKMGKIRKIFISGGSGALTGEKVSEAGDLKETFLYAGVPESAIIIEDKSRNTHESSVMSKKIADSLGLKGKFLLITSAFHMKRSIGCFTKAGFKVDEFPVDFGGGGHFSLPSLIPTENGLSTWSLLIHEVTGYVIYKFMGYV